MGSSNDNDHCNRKSGSQYLYTGPTPSAWCIYGYLRAFFTLFQLEPECCVYAYIYIKRLLSKANGKLTLKRDNWQTVVVGACILASKVVDDHTMKNRDFSTGLAGFSLTYINRLELQLLQVLKWEVHVPISEYTTHYFELAAEQPHAQKNQGHDWHVTIAQIRPQFAVTTHALSSLYKDLCHE